MFKEIYEAPEIEVIELHSDGIITASCPPDSCWGDGDVETPELPIG